MEEKEGGWGWAVVAASFLVHFVVGGVGYSSGIIYLTYLNEYEGSHFQTACVFGLLMSFSVFGAIPSSILAHFCGYRITVMLGGILASGGLGLSYLAKELYQEYLYIGLMTGLGFGIALTSSIMAVQSYFHKKRELALSIAICGTSCGTIAFPVILDAIDEHFDFRGYKLVLSGICLNIVICGALIRPKNDNNKCKRMLKMFAFILFKSPAFCMLLLSNFTWSIGISLIFTYLPSFTISAGSGLDHALTLVAVTGSISLVVQVLVRIFNAESKMDIVTTTLCSVGIAVILTGLFPDLLGSKAGSIGYALCLGIHIGYWSVFVADVTKELIGEHYLAMGKGFISLSIGLGLFSGPALGGFIYDQTEDYDIMFYLAGACLVCGSSIMVITYLKPCYFFPSFEDWDSISDSMSFRSNQSQEEDQMLITSFVSVL